MGQFENAGYSCEIAFIDDYFCANQMPNNLAIQKAFESDFEFGFSENDRLGDVWNRESRNLKTALVDQFFAKSDGLFVIFSAVWIEAIRRYWNTRQSSAQTIPFVRLDAVDGFTFAYRPAHASVVQPIQMFNARDTKLNFVLDFAGFDAQPFTTRARRIVKHGGGWHIGSVENAIEGYHFSCITRHMPNFAEGDHEYYLDLTDELAFGLGKLPRLGKVNNGTVCELEPRPYVQTIDIIAKSAAILSKPGGGTIAEAIATETPLICQRPCNDLEVDNLDFVLKSGIGMLEADFRNAQDKAKCLLKMHHRIRDLKISVPRLSQALLTLLNPRQADET